MTVLLVVGIGALLMVSTLFSFVMMLCIRADLPTFGMACVVFGPSTCALAMYVAWRCVRERRESHEAASICLSGALLAGGANVPFVALFVGLVTLTHPWHLMMAVVVGSMCGMVLGCPLGFVFGAASLRPIKLGCRRPSSVDGNDVTSQVCWGWLSSLALVCALFVAGGLIINGGPHDGAVVPAIFGAISLASRWAAWRAARRREQRRRVFDRILNGLDESWTVVPLEEMSEWSTESLPALFFGEHESAEAVLARRSDTYGDGAYRQGDLLVPIALVSNR
jgi:hypothetical protein